MATGRDLIALEDFYRARRRAELEKMFSFLTGKSAELLSFNAVLKTIKITGSLSKRRSFTKPDL
jgi:hypothetical protein